MNEQIDIVALVERVKQLEIEVKLLKAGKKSQKQTVPDVLRYTNCESAIHRWFEGQTVDWEQGVFGVLVIIVRQKCREFMCMVGKVQYIKVKDKWERMLQDRWDNMAQIVKEKILGGFRNQEMNPDESESYMQSLLSILQFKLSGMQKSNLTRISREAIWS